MWDFDMLELSTQLINIQKTLMSPSNPFIFLFLKQAYNIIFFFRHNSVSQDRRKGNKS